MIENTSSDNHPEAIISACWRKNAVAWREAIAAAQIASRVLVTNAAIMAAILAQDPGYLLDLGCGEGWLCRRLWQEKQQQPGLAHCEIMGVDASQELLDIALALNPDPEIRFQAVDYFNLRSVFSGQRPFDTIVCNFSLLGEHSVAAVFAALPQILAPGGRLIVQTLHPESQPAEIRSQPDRWHAGSWDGFSSAFRDPAPWFYRQRSSWRGLFAAAGLTLQEINPQHPETEAPLSAILIGHRP